MQAPRAGNKEVWYLAVAASSCDPPQTILLHTLLAWQVRHFCRLSNLVSALQLFLDSVGCWLACKNPFQHNAWYSLNSCFTLIGCIDGFKKTAGIIIYKQWYDHAVFTLFMATHSNRQAIIFCSCGNLSSFFPRLFSAVAAIKFGMGPHCSLFLICL